MSSSEVYRDSLGKALSDYDQPSVAVDTAVLTIDPEGALSVVVIPTGSTSRLPGAFVHKGETLSRAVARSLRDKAGISGLRPQQLQVFDDPQRDPRGWVMSVAHVDVVRFDDLASSDRVRLRPVSDARGLAYDHDRIVELAVERLRAEYTLSPDPAGLIAEPAFTLRDLLNLHSAVAGESLQRDNFRRLMQPQLLETGERKVGVVGKPPRLFVKR